MRKLMRKAVKLEAKIQALAVIKVNGTMDERSYARRRLSSGLSSRYQPTERLGSCDATDIVLGGRKVM